MVELLEKVISSLPTQDAELFDAHECFPGFLKWNSEWEKLYNSDPMKGKLHFNTATHNHLYLGLFVTYNILYLFSVIRKQFYNLTAVCI